MPPSDAFWKTIESARKGSSPLAPSANPHTLYQVLLLKSSEEVATFGREFYQALIDLNSWELWGAGHVMVDDMSGDSFHYFRSWIIGKGKDAYQAALQSPDDLGRFVGEEEQEFDNELLEYVPVEILETRGLPDPRDDFDVFPDDERRGVAWDMDTVYEFYPQLGARFHI